MVRAYKERRIYYFICEGCGKKNSCSFYRAKAKIKKCRKCRKNNKNENQQSLFDIKTKDNAQVNNTPVDNSEIEKQILNLITSN